MMRGPLVDLERCPRCGGVFVLDMDYVGPDGDEAWFTACEDCSLLKPEDAAPWLALRPAPEPWATPPSIMGRAIAWALEDVDGAQLRYYDLGPRLADAFARGGAA